MRICKRWTQEEDLKIKELSIGGKITFTQMMPFLPGRTYKAINCRSAYLGINLRDNGYIYKKHSKDENFWKIPNITNCYWSGIALADMCVGPKLDSVSWGISIVDKLLMEQFIKDTKWTGTYRTNWNKASNSNKYTEIIQISIYSCQNWTKDMNDNFNITPQKTYRLIPPTFEKDILNYSLLKGMVDGDGTLFFSEDKEEFLITISSCSESMILWFKNLMEKDFDKCLIRNAKRKIYHNKKNGYYNYAIHGIKAIKLYQLLDSIPTFCLERKWKNEKIRKALELYKYKYPDFFNDRDYKFDDNGMLIKPNFGNIKKQYFTKKRIIERKNQQNSLISSVI